MKVLNAVVISASAYAQLEALKEEHLKQSIEEGIAKLQAGKVSDGKSVIDKVRKRAGWCITKHRWPERTIAINPLITIVSLCVSRVASSALRFSCGILSIHQGEHR